MSHLFHLPWSALDTAVEAGVIDADEADTAEYVIRRLAALVGHPSVKDINLIGIYCDHHIEPSRPTELKQ